MESKNLKNIKVSADCKDMDKKNETSKIGTK